MNRLSRRMMFGASRRFASACNEKALQQAILNTLNYKPDTFAWAMETRGAPYRTASGGFVMVRNSWGKGKPDIAGIRGGLGFVMEVKMPGGKLRPEQKEWLENYTERGKGKAFVVHSVEEAEKAWESV